ncbi:MAG: hypothetical protein IT352_01725 [Gemmatimonadales bacterium]|nr:hypothetical protein [Gemmatimonadales bacterium]
MGHPTDGFDSARGAASSVRRRIRSPSSVASRALRRMASRVRSFCSGDRQLEAGGLEVKELAGHGGTFSGPTRSGRSTPTRRRLVAASLTASLAALRAAEERIIALIAVMTIGIPPPLVEPVLATPNRELATAASAMGLTVVGA